MKQMTSTFGLITLCQSEVMCIFYCARLIFLSIRHTHTHINVSVEGKSQIARFLSFSPGIYRCRNPVYKRENQQKFIKDTYTTIHKGRKILCFTHCLTSKCQASCHVFAVSYIHVQTDTHANPKKNSCIESNIKINERLLSIKC